jgi:tetratricopeptide (TPR) repeat protein
MRFATWLTSILIALLPSAARACLWDSDTLRDERRGLPGIAEVLAGRWERHSAFFYEDRAKRAAATVEREPTNLAAWDDLAVAYEKLGQVDRAIETIERKAALKPGEYTTEANWGTFLVHRGDYEAGLAHLRRALEINPDAHFGRERYQVMAVEYLIAGKADPSVFERGSFAWPIAAADALAGRPLPPTTSPEDELWQQEDVLYRLRRNGIRHAPRPAVDAAITGVVGMLRFGPGTSPHLYAALGDLMIARGDLHLAYRAFKRARDNGHPSPTWVDARLEACREGSDSPDGFDDAQIAAERAAGEAWSLAYQRFEDDLVRRGVAVDDAALAPFYETHGGRSESLGRMGLGEMWFKLKNSPGAAIPLFAFVLAFVMIVMRRLRLRLGGGTAPAA